jgi:hypothetical protein
MSEQGSMTKTGLLQGPLWRTIAANTSDHYREHREWLQHRRGG